MGKLAGASLSGENSARMRRRHPANCIPIFQGAARSAWKKQWHQDCQQITDKRTLASKPMDKSSTDKEFALAKKRLAGGLLDSRIGSFKHTFPKKQELICA